MAQAVNYSERNISSKRKDTGPLTNKQSSI